MLESDNSVDAAYAYLANYLPENLKVSEFDWIDRIVFWNSFFRSRIATLKSDEETKSLMIDVTYYCRFVHAAL